MNGYLMALDQGTTSSRAIVYDLKMKVLAMAYQEFNQYTSRESWIEHDAMEIWDSQIRAARKALAKTERGIDSLLAIGVTNQRETTIVWNKSGKPSHCLAMPSQRTHLPKT